MDFQQDEPNAKHASLSFGFQLVNEYNQTAKGTDFMGIGFNTRLGRFYIMDTRGVTSWKHDSFSMNSRRELTYPKYHNRLLRVLMYCEKHNVYFAICNDFSLQVYNKNFDATCTAESQNMRTILHLVFNPSKDELISSGLAGTSIWKYQQMKTTSFGMIKPMANFSLVLKAHYTDVGGTWCTKVHLVDAVQQLFFCSDTGLIAYNANTMKLLFHLSNAHSAAVTCVGFSVKMHLLISGSLDAEVKVWSATGSHIFTFRGHSKVITSVIIHPQEEELLMTSSLDGTVKVWSLNVMEQMCSINVMNDGIDWMGITPNGTLWCASLRQILVYNFNSVAEFWALTRCRLSNLDMVSDANKTNRIMAVGQDGSIRFFKQATYGTEVLCTVLPPPIISLEDSKIMVSYGRHHNKIFVLLDAWRIWVYTGKTDPACRIAEWNVAETQKLHPKDGESQSDSEEIEKPKHVLSKQSMLVMNRPSSRESTYHPVAECTSVACVTSKHGFTFFAEFGLCSSLSRHLLLLGLKDGRILFCDQNIRNLKYFEMVISTGPVMDISSDSSNQRIFSRCNQFDAVFQVWSLPDLQQLFKVSVPIDVTAHCLLDDFLVFGHCTGQLYLKKISAATAIADSAAPINTADQSVCNDTNSHMFEHRAAVTNIKACATQKIFCSCSSDGVIKVWNYNQMLLTEISLDETLSGCVFLNSSGDLLIGWKKHVFLIHHQNVASHTICMSSESLDMHDCESDIFEDPAFKHDMQINTDEIEPLNMERYLVPYSFVHVEDSDVFLANDKVSANKDDAESSCSSGDSLHANTETYISPASSYQCLACLNLLDCPKSNPYPKCTSDTKDFTLPLYGISPGPTPPESVVSEFECDEEECLVDEIHVNMDKEDENMIDMAQQVNLAKNVQRAVSLMKNIEESDDEDTREEVYTSRLSQTRFETRSMMKVAVAAVMAAQKFQSPRSEHSLIKQRSHSMSKAVVKKSRKASTSNMKLHRKSTEKRFDTDDDDTLSPSLEGPLMSNDMSAATPLTNVAFEGMEVPFGKGVSIPGKQSKRPPRAITTALKSAKHVAPPGGAVSNRHRVQKSKSAGLVRRKSVQDKSNAHQSMVNVADKKYSTMNESQTSLTSTDDNKSVTGSKPVTRVHMTYKKSAQYKSTENRRPNEDNPPLKEVALLKNEQPSGDAKFKAERAACREEDAKNVECLPSEHLDDYEYDRTPDMLDLDLQAIYKKDGLQFDESWQERMLKRYQLMKLQREQRHSAAANKRVMLESQRKYKILSNRPELMYADAYAWYEDHAHLAEHIMNSPLLNGSAGKLNTDTIVTKQPPTCVSVLSHARMDKEPPAARPSSVADSLHPLVRHGLTDVDAMPSSANVKYRFSIRPTSDDRSSVTSEQPLARPNTMESRTPDFSRIPAATPTSVTNFRGAKSSGLKNKLFDRPRSSVSIPGKTRYVLVKSEPSLLSKGRTPSPTKLEDNLLKKRFPGQHQVLMRTLGKADSDEDYVAETKPHLPNEVDWVVNDQKGARQRNVTATESLFRSLSPMHTGRSLQRMSSHEPLRESSPAVFPTLIRDSSFMSVLHRKSSAYVPAAFQV